MLSMVVLRGFMAYRSPLGRIAHSITLGTLEYLPLLSHGFYSRGVSCSQGPNSEASGTNENDADAQRPVVSIDRSGLYNPPEPTAATKLYLPKRLKRLCPDDIPKLEHVEVCPHAIELTHGITNRIGSDGGGALIIDYGQNGIISDSLQSQFLGSLGINFRVEALLQNATEEQAEALQIGYWRLVGDGPAPFWEGKDELAPIGMGSRYLALAIINKHLGAPVCFQ